MEDERKPIADPLYAEWKAVNEPYRLVREPLTKLFDEVRRRVTAFKRRIEAERAAEAERLRREAEEKERIAREAERMEQDAIACADVGECTDVGAAIEEADATFRDFARSSRAAAVAERNVPVRVPSIVGGKALAMKTRRVLTVTDAVAAVRAIGPTEEIIAAIIKCAKPFEQATGELPAGVKETFERSM